jgi:hypothetical protein
MVITKFERVMIPQTLEGQKFADAYERKIRERMSFISRSEDMRSIILESRYYEEVENGNDN